MKRLAFLIINLAAVFPVSAEEQTTLPEVKVIEKIDAIAERREATTQKIMLERKDIENMGVMTIGEVLGKLPGVELASGGMGQRARGMSRDSVQILVDGERSAAGGAMVGIVGRLPSGDLERVEILRGSSAEFGGAASVTVNLIMKKALPKSSTEARAGVGRRGTESYSQLAWKKNGGEGGFSWSLPISLLWSNSPATRSVDRQDTAAGVRTLWQQESESGAAKMGHHAIAPRMTWKGGSDSLTIAPLFLFGPQDTNRNSALTAYSNPAAGTGLAFNGDRISSENTMQRVLRLRTEGEKHIGDSKFSGRVSLNNMRHTTDVARDAHDAANVLTTSTEHTDSNEKETNLALRLDKPVGEHLLAVGVEHVNLRRTQDQNFTGSFASVSSFQAQERQSTVWVQDDWTVQTKTTITYGLRGEAIALDSAGVSQQHGRLLPSLAVRWEPMDKWVMRSSLGAGLKMPKLDEISNAATPSIAANTPVEADKRGNPGLLPERSLNFEAVLERYLDGEAGVLGGNLYVRSTRDFTERRVQLEGVRWVDRPCNEGSALHWGWELDGKLRADSLGWKGATVKAHLTLPHAQVNDARLGIQRMARDTPNYVLSAGLDESLPRLQSSFGISMQLSGRSETEIPGEQRGFTEARTTLDAFWLRKLTPQFNLRISGQNLLAADTVRETLYMSGNNTWQLRTVEGGYRTIMATLEGRW
ncbi:MAG: TonB-dependent receptor [Gallionella sp.]|nr:TonB-dependent receptor [Gallionella sp.]